MKKSLLLICFTIIIATVLVPLSASAYAPSDFSINAEFCVLANTDTGVVLYSKNADERLYPASVTKLLTALVVCDSVADYDETVTIDGDLIDTLLGTDSSLSYIVRDEVLTIDQLLHYLLITSGNDTALVLAKHVGGTIDRFIEMMNEKAIELGMNSSHFANPHGLPDSDHYTTANDIYKLASAAFKVDEIKDICSFARYTIPATNMHGERVIANTNFLIDPSTMYYYKYCTGGKTGYTDSAGRCLVSTAEKDGMHYLCVMMKADPEFVNSSGEYERIEFSDSKRMYEWAFKNFGYKTVIEKNEYITDIDVNLSWETGSVKLLAGESLTALLPNEADRSSVEIDVGFLQDKSVDAAIEEGQLIAVASVYYADEKIGTINLVAESAAKRSLMQYSWFLIKRAARTLWFKLIFVVIAITLALYWIIATAQINAIKRKRNRLRKHR